MINPDPLRYLTDKIYLALFGKTTLSLLLHLKLSPLEIMDEQDNALRDSLGQLALEALSKIERQCAKDFRQYNKGNVSFGMLEELVQIHATEVAIEAKAMAAGEGIDLLSGERLEQK